MADQFVAEIRMFPFNFAPTGWALCNGQLMPISQNTALFSLLGTTYGGDGKSTFGLPNLQGSAPMQPGQGTGLSQYDLGQSGGDEMVTLLQSEMPAHSHNLQASTLNSQSTLPTNNALGRGNPVKIYTDTTTSVVQMAPNSIGIAGGGLPHNNMMPYLTLNFCIALNGIFPQRQ